MSDASILYLPHGGGPMPLLQEPSHRALSAFLSSAAKQLRAPKYLIVVSAHWESEEIRVLSAPAPGMLFDYYGFPAESYQYRYSAPGAPGEAARIVAALNAGGLPARCDDSRDYDHGIFVPLMLMYPAADLPVVQVSLNQSLDASVHLRLGELLAPFLDEGAVLIGSGLSFHNMRAFGQGTSALEKSRRFDDWLQQSVQSAPADARAQLARWQDAPEARYCHPREEHLLPLHVCVGAASARGVSLQSVFSDQLMGVQVTAFAG